ncbi:MAG TPA: TIGR03435 family protein [Bryobacteraceae bacterium]|jgi:uncharacterized protein (TIGR03435 family)|nr:TIGR03435 family protein [Bryobacteraceae bacterium]
MIMRSFAGATLVALLSGSVFGQTTDAKPVFEIADVQVSAPSTSTNVYMRGGVIRGGRYEVRTANMVDLISTAFGVDRDKVLGGPNWLELDRFDLIAKVPSTTTPEDLKLMLQALLADRFKLVVHTDSKPLPAFVLSLGKGKPKLKEANGDGNMGCQNQPQTPEPGKIPNAVVACRNMPMAAFVLNLRGMAGNYLTGPVVDQTGLKGTWDFDLTWTARALLSVAGSDAISVFDAVDKQLGLKLESQRVPTPVIVVDSVNEKPTDNPPGVTKSVPPAPPAEFEVADIKPSLPDAKQNGRMQNGRLDLVAFPLKMLINVAWDINSDEMLAGAPKWLDSARFDVIAKASTEGPVPQVDFEALRLMLRALLVDRFQMKTHMEDRPINAYNLVAAKPKLKKADPANRTGCKEGPPPDGKDPRDANPMLSRLLTCQNMTMAQFAGQLPNLASGYIHSPVVDATGLDGAWDFTLSFSAAGLLQLGQLGTGRGGETGQPAGSAPTASDPNGAVSLFDAVNKQLGLKLEMQKRPAAVLVIDHIEEKPTEN